MMRIKGTTITITRGDTLRVKIDMKTADGAEHIHAADAIATNKWWVIA